MSAAPTATVSPLRRQQLHRGPGEGPVADQAGTADRRDPENLVDDVTRGVGGDAAEPGVPDPVQRVEVGLRVRGRRDTHPLGQRPEPIEPVHRGALTGAGVCGRGRPGIRPVVDHVAARHRVDGDEQVGVDGQARREADVPVGVDLRAGGELHRRQQRVEAPALRE